mmetsp:Transcript_7350/g.27923  ORF Transcript_7350/g.27923 Transcript_7350/m.27923 type:complete len:88 (-) Transcript_7350:788-1051(-)
MPGRSDVKMKEYPKEMLANPQTALEKLSAREVATREKAVVVAEARLLKDKMKECYYREGVNAYQHCDHLAREYMDLIMSDRFRQADP